MNSLTGSVSEQPNTEERVAMMLAEQWGYHYLDLRTNPPAPEATAMIPGELARRYRLIPIDVCGRELVVAMSDPHQFDALRDVSFACGLSVRPVVGAPGAIEQRINSVYRPRSEIDELVEESASDSPLKASDRPLQILSPVTVQPPLQDVTRQSEAAPIVRLVDHLLRAALERRASDLHLEPGAGGCRIRYRVDGLLREDQVLPPWMQAAVVSRLKVLARLDIAERRLPQDGSFRIRTASEEVDCRVAVLPVVHGEKVVVRLLTSSTYAVTLEALGCPERQLGQWRAWLRCTKGILLVTGPTGSGKTTTLYAMLRALHTPERNIVTVEDPIEYQIAGVNQVQIHPETGLTFAQVLRALLRQDPDIMLVGEIRDGETAEIAFRAAMTGHLVLSTLHTNDAPSTITRLLDLGVPRYLVVSQLVGVVAQRLVRTICAGCRRVVTPPEELMAALRLSSETFGARPVYTGSGCAECQGQGYLGRVGVFETFPLSAPIRELIAAGASEQALRAAALSAGMASLGMDGLDRVRQGSTTLEEVARATLADEAAEIQLLPDGWLAR